MRMTLTKEEVLRHASQYSYKSYDVVAARLEAAATRGFMTREDLIAVAEWKWRGGRTSQLAAQNTECEVQEITKVAFSATSERLKIGALLALRGVNWPMASVILHFAFSDQYPILDARAMKTVGGSTNYTLERWIQYTELCRKSARDLGVTMRVLDRALWSADKVQSSKRP